MPPWYLEYRCDIPKGRHDFPTIIVRCNQSCNKIYLLLFINILKYLDEASWKLKETLTDESYYERDIYIKDSKYKEVDASLFKSLQFDPEFAVKVIYNQVLYWNVPIIFI